LQGPSQLSTPLYSQLILRIYTAMNGLGGAPKLSLLPGAGNPKYATGDEATICTNGKANTYGIRNWGEEGLHASASNPV